MRRVVITLAFMLLASVSAEAQVARRVELVAGLHRLDPRNCTLPELPGGIVAVWLPDSTRDRIAWCIDVGPVQAMSLIYSLYIKSASIELDWTRFGLSPVCIYASTVEGKVDPARSF